METLGRGVASLAAKVWAAGRKVEAETFHFRAEGDPHAFVSRGASSPLAPSWSVLNRRRRRRGDGACPGRRRTFRVLISNEGQWHPCLSWPSDWRRGTREESRDAAQERGWKEKRRRNEARVRVFEAGVEGERDGGVAGSTVEATSAAVVVVVVVRGARHKYVCIIRCDLPHYPTRSDSCFITMSTLPRPVPFLRSPFKWMARNHRSSPSADRSLSLGHRAWPVIDRGERKIDIERESALEFSVSDKKILCLGRR